MSLHRPPTKIHLPWNQRWGSSANFKPLNRYNSVRDDRFRLNFARGRTMDLQKPRNDWNQGGCQPQIFIILIAIT